MEEKRRGEMPNQSKQKAKKTKQCGGRGREGGIENTET